MNIKRLLGETIIYGIGAILPRIITFLLNPLYINYIDKEAFAIFTSLYAWIAFINIMLTFGFETSYFRYASEDGMHQKVFNTSFWFVTGLATLFLLTVLLFNYPLATLLDYASNPEYLRWFAWIAFFDAVCTIPFAWLRFHNKPVMYSAIRVSSILIQTVLVIALFRFVPMDFAKSIGLKQQVSYPFFSNLVASFSTFVMLLPIVVKVKFDFSKNLFKKMLSYSYPVMLAGLAFMVNENFDKIIQYYTIDKGDAGAYGGAYKLAVLMTLFVTAYRMGIEPFLFKQMKNADATRTYATLTEYFTLTASVVALGIIANISWLKRLFITDSSYWTAIDIVPIIVIANLFFGIYYNLSTWYKVTDRTKIGTAISWFGAGLTILLHILFLQKYGFMVSAWVTLVVYASMTAISYVLGQKMYPIPYKTKKIGGFLAILMLFSVIIVSVFDMNFWLSNALWLIYIALVLLVERGLLKELLRR
ncbi:lipopolysaccharide biosynthesis protein [Faucicola boevrei]|uniref:lipopolysaccharide biosynthesis protein n=1 Tax=Faucicola boevrei TaxID=346665 RepID=UPI00035E5C4B|nr:oligosaccharide flippase family protein [Moraxella boevrei]